MGELLRYHKIGYDAPKELATRKYRFSFSPSFCVSKDQTAGSPFKSKIITNRFTLVFLPLKPMIKNK